PAAVGVAAADALHFLAMTPRRCDQHVAAEAAAAHRLHAVIEVAPGRADLDGELVELGLGLALGGSAEAAVAIDRGTERAAHLRGDFLRACARGSRQVTAGVL